VPHSNRPSELAGMLSRAGAFAIDLFGSFAVISAVARAIPGPLGILVGIAGAGAYFVACWAVGGTIGDDFMRITVIGTDGKLIGYPRAALRLVALVAGSLPSFAGLSSALADEHRQAWQRLAREEGVTFTDAGFWATFGKRNDDIIPAFWGPLSPERIQALADRKESYFRELIRENAVPLPGAMELMRGLHEAGFAQALASSTPIENIQLISKVLGLERYLSALVSGETVARGKPAPDIFLKAAEELHMHPSACVVIEDAVAGVQAAHAAGMRCIAVAGDRDLPGLREAELMVKSLTEVDVERIRALG